MARAAEETVATVIDLNPEEWRAFLDAQARDLIGMSWDEFARRWDAGEWREVADLPENWDYLYLAMLGITAR